jgi:hypothetical protein
MTLVVQRWDCSPGKETPPFQWKFTAKDLMERLDALKNFISA